MRVSEWFQPPRQLLVVFLALAGLSIGAVAWLAWQLLEQDKALQTQRRQERLEQAADRAVSVLQRAVIDLQALARTGLDATAIPDGLSIVVLGGNDTSVTPAGTVPFLPMRAAPAAPDRSAFAEGDRLEFLANDLAGAARVYAAASRSADAAIRADALLRLARVHRKRQRVDDALQAYAGLLDTPDDLRVHGLPATLLARAGRASALDEAGRTSALRAEAGALRSDLSGGRWRLTRSEYEYYLGQAHAWLGIDTADRPRPDPRAEGPGPVHSASCLDSGSPRARGAAVARSEYGATRSRLDA